jgi:hypothetical protein
MAAHTINLSYDPTYNSLPRNLIDLVQIGSSDTFEYYQTHSGIMVVVQKVTINSVDRRYFVVTLPDDSSTVAQRFTKLDLIKTQMIADTDHSSKLDWVGAISAIIELTKNRPTISILSGE